MDPLRTTEFRGKVTGRTPSTARKDFYDGDYNLISPADLDNGKFIRTAHKTLTTLGFEQCRALPKGTVLVGCIGNVGKLGIVGNDQSATNQQINALICNQEHDHEFVYYCFHENRDKLEKRAVKTTVPILNKTNFGNFEVNVPPLPEQKKIAHILSTVQRAIEAQERIIQTTTELKKALMHKLFTEGLRNEPQKQTEIGPVPESWGVKPLIDTVEFIDYGVSQAIPKTPTPEGVKIVSTADIDKQGNLLYWKIRRIVVPVKTANRLVLKDGDVLFNWRNSAELIGKSTIYEEQDEPHIFASFILRICAGEKKSHNYFLKHLMNHYREEGVFVKLARRAVNQANYNKNEISVLTIPSPPYEQQVEIANAIGAVDAKIWSHVDKKRCLEGLFRTLLHELMTAKTRVHHLEIETPRPAM